MSGDDHRSKRARVNEDSDAAIGRHGMPKADDLPDWLKDIAQPQAQQQNMAPFPTGQDLFPYAPVSNEAVKILEIPANLKSGIIGKGGHLINYIRSQCQSDIQIQQPTGADFATITIRGNVAAAEKMIQEQIEGLQKHGDSEVWVSELVDVPQNLVALVVGPQGKKLHELMEKSGCQMKFIKETEVRSGAPPGKQICSVRGPANKLEYGCQLVREQTEQARVYDRKKTDKKREAEVQRSQPTMQVASAASMGGSMGAPAMGGNSISPFPQQSRAMGASAGTSPFPQQSVGMSPFPQQSKSMGGSSGMSAFPQQSSSGSMGGSMGGSTQQSGSMGGRPSPFPQQNTVSNNGGSHLWR